jgi:hypothetical protein
MNGNTRDGSAPNIGDQVRLLHRLFIHSTHAETVRVRRGRPLIMQAGRAQAARSTPPLLDAAGLSSKQRCRSLPLRLVRLKSVMLDLELSLAM